MKRIRVNRSSDGPYTPPELSYPCDGCGCETDSYGDWNLCTNPDCHFCTEEIYQDPEEIAVEYY